MNKTDDLTKRAEAADAEVERLRAALLAVVETSYVESDAVRIARAALSGNLARARAARPRNG